MAIVHFGPGELKSLNVGNWKFTDKDNYCGRQTQCVDNTSQNLLSYHFEKIWEDKNWHQLGK